MKQSWVDAVFARILMGRVREGETFDVIIVLGAAVWKGNRPSPTLRRRLLHGVALWKRGVAVHLLVSGGEGEYPPAEARMMETLALRDGVPPERIIAEDRSASTFESAVRCVDIMKKKGWSSAVVVTDGYHLPRSLLVFRSFGVQVRGSAADRGTSAASRGWLPPAREVIAVFWYLLRITAFKLRRRI